MGVGTTQAQAVAGAAAVTAGGRVALADDVLQGGEIVIIVLRPHIGAVVLRSLPFVVPMIAAAFAGVLWLHLPKSQVIGVLGAMVLGIFLWQGMEWALTRYVLTDRRVMSIRGGSGFGGAW